MSPATCPLSPVTFPQAYRGPSTIDVSQFQDQLAPIAFIDEDLEEQGVDEGLSL